MPLIDAHMHFIGDHPASLQLLRDFDLKMLNICWVDTNATWRKRRSVYRELAECFPDFYAWCTTFDVPDYSGAFDADEYAARVIAEVEQDFAAGALACKALKNIGMEVRKTDGTYLLIDDPVFDPIFRYLAQREKPLLLHNADPLASWQPPNPRSPHYEYYAAEPEWYMYGRADAPDRDALLAAQDHVLEKHPNLRVIWAHLGALEYDVGEIARRLRRYPNLAVDTSARLVDLAEQDTSTVRDFMLQQADRVLFGIDAFYEVPHSTLSTTERDRILEDTRQKYRAYLDYLGSDRRFRHQQWEITGLALPAAVLEKICYANARIWYPGL